MQMKREPAACVATAGLGSRPPPTPASGAGAARGERGQRPWGVCPSAARTSQGQGPGVPGLQGPAERGASPRARTPSAGASVPVATGTAGGAAGAEPGVRPRAGGRGSSCRSSTRRRRPGEPEAASRSFWQPRAARRDGGDALRGREHGSPSPGLCPGPLAAHPGALALSPGARPRGRGRSERGCRRRRCRETRLRGGRLGPALPRRRARPDPLRRRRSRGGWAARPGPHLRPRGRARGAAGVGAAAPQRPCRRRAPRLGAPLAAKGPGAGGRGDPGTRPQPLTGTAGGRGLWDAASHAHSVRRAFHLAPATTRSMHPTPEPPRGGGQRTPLLPRTLQLPQIIHQVMLSHTFGLLTPRYGAFLKKSLSPHQIPNF